MVALGQIADKRATNPLIEILYAGGPLACYAASALGQLGDKQAVQPLIRALDREFGDEGLRTFAAHALGKLGDDQSLGPLLTALQDANVDVRFCAAEGLGYLGNEQALPLLQLAQQDDGWCDLGQVKFAAMEAIKLIQQRGPTNNETAS